MRRTQTKRTAPVLWDEPQLTRGASASSAPNFHDESHFSFSIAVFLASRSSGQHFLAAAMGS